MQMSRVCTNSPAIFLFAMLRRPTVLIFCLGMIAILVSWNVMLGIYSTWTLTSTPTTARSNLLLWWLPDPVADFWDAVSQSIVTTTTSSLALFNTTSASDSIIINNRSEASIHLNTTTTAIMVTWRGTLRVRDLLTQSWTVNPICQLWQEQVLPRLAANNQDNNISMASSVVLNDRDAKDPHYHSTERLQERNQPVYRTVLVLMVHLELDCDYLAKTSTYGTGNLLALLYGLRGASQTLPWIDSSTVESSLSTATIQLHMHCRDARQHAHELVLPWVMGSSTQQLPTDSAIFMSFRGPTLISGSKTREKSMSPPSICGPIYGWSLASMIPSIQRELRRMALALVGIPPTDHPTHSRVQSYIQSLSSLTSATRSPNPSLIQPSLDLPMIDGWLLDILPDHGQSTVYPWTDLLPKNSLHKIVLDDAVIHFRCGDLMSGKSNFRNYGFIPFASYTQALSPEVRSIGIVTQPLEATGRGQVRAQDIGTAAQQERCGLLLGWLQQYLHQEFPKARITVHNHPEHENGALAFSRIIMANQTRASWSSFAGFPIMASFGSGVLSRPRSSKDARGRSRGGPNQWFFSEASKLNSYGDQLAASSFDVKWVDEPKALMGHGLNRMWDLQGPEYVLAFLWGNDTELTETG